MYNRSLSLSLPHTLGSFLILSFYPSWLCEFHLIPHTIFFSHLVSVCYLVWLGLCFQKALFLSRVQC